MRHKTSIWVVIKEIITFFAVYVIQKINRIFDDAITHIAIIATRLIRRRCLGDYNRFAQFRVQIDLINQVNIEYNLKLRVKTLLVFFCWFWSYFIISGFEHFSFHGCCLFFIVVRFVVEISLFCFALVFLEIPFSSMIVRFLLKFRENIFLF